VSFKKVDFSLNSCYERIMRHRGLKYSIFIHIGSTSLANFSEVALLCVNFVDLQTLQIPLTHTLCVLFVLCPEVQ